MVRHVSCVQDVRQTIAIRRHMPRDFLPVLLQQSMATRAPGPSRLSAQKTSSDTAWVSPFAQVQAVGDSDAAPLPASQSQQASAQGPSVRTGSDRSPFAQVQQQQPQARASGGDLTAASPFGQVQQQPQQPRSSSRELSPFAAAQQQPARQRSGEAASASPFAQAQLQQPTQSPNALQTAAFRRRDPATGAGEADQALGFGSGDLVAGQPAPQAQQQPAQHRSPASAYASPVAEAQQPPQTRSSGDESSSSGDQQQHGHSLSTLAAATAGSMSPDEAGHSGAGGAELPAMTSPFAGQGPFSGQLLDLKADSVAHLLLHHWAWGNRNVFHRGCRWYRVAGAGCPWQALPCLQARRILVWRTSCAAACVSAVACGL